MSDSTSTLTTPTAKRNELQSRLQTLNVLEAELASLRPQANIYNSVTTAVESPLIAHAHSQTALFPNLDKESALKDVRAQKKVILANLQQHLQT